jgi:hypothetical protein
MTTTRRWLGLWLGSVVALLGCGESAVGPQSATRARTDWFAFPELGLLKCAPLPTDSATATIDSTGGVIQIGAHTLTIPPGALSVPVTITAVAPSDTVNRIVFQPTGLRFRESARLTMSYGNCGVLTALLPQIAYTTDSLQILRILESETDPVAQTVTAPLRHFSDYAVAW